MKKYIMLFVLALVICSYAGAQKMMFSLTVTNGNMVNVFVTPIGGNITSDLANFEYFVEYPSSQSLTLGTITSGTSFPSISYLAGNVNTDQFGTFTDGGTATFHSIHFGPSSGTQATATYVSGTPYLLASFSLSGITANNIDVHLRGDNVNSPNSGYAVVYSPTNGLVGPNNNGDWAIEDGTSPFITSQLISGSDYKSTEGAVLPVILTGFTATANGCAANLTWHTSMESNSSFYAVEASTDGTNFNQLGAVASKNCATGASYAYSHGIGSSTEYFRLKALDFDGNFVYSNIVSVIGKGECSTGIQIIVSPNPASNMVNIKNLDGSLNLVALYDLTGKLMTEITTTAIHQSINIATYASGMYLLRIQSASGKVVTVKVIKE